MTGFIESHRKVRCQTPRGPIRQWFFACKVDGRDPACSGHIGLGLKDDLPVFISTNLEEFTINDFVEILSEIPSSGTASKLLTGTGHRKDGPFVSLPEK